MSKKPGTPNLTLRRIREQELRLTRAGFAEALGLKAYELGDSIEPSERYIARLEFGEIRWPQPACRRALETLCGRPITELGFTCPQPGAIRGLAAVLPVMTAGQAPGADLLAGGAWPTWFGIRLAQLIGLVDRWHSQNGQVSALQGILAQEVAMFNASAPAPGEPEHAAFEQSRRQALTTLAALPLGFATANILDADGSGVVAAQQMYLSQCAASITACWQLLRGSDLTVVDHVLASCLIPLEGIAHQHSKHQKTAATLASQAHRMRGLVANHHKQIAAHEHHARQALRYATVASDISAQVIALNSLGQAQYWQAQYYGADPAQALVTFERMSALESKMPPQHRSRLHAELAAVYGQLGQEQDALRAAGHAEDIYPDHPEDDPGYLFAELTPAVLGLKQGLAYLALAEQHEERGYQRKAADVLGKIDQIPAMTVSDRVRTEIANHQARAAVLLDDMEAFGLHIHSGLDGAALLGSKQRLREARHACQLAADRWPNEPRVRAITQRLQLTASDSSAGSAGSWTG